MRKRKMDTPPLLALIKTSEANGVPASGPSMLAQDALQPAEDMALVLRTAVKTAGKAAGGKNALARLLGLTSAAVCQWRKIPAERVVEIEELTGVQRDVLRPDLYAQPTLTGAIKILRAAGYRVSKPRAPKKFKRGKDRVGPTFVAEFSDGVVTRMSVFTSLKELDWDRGERLSIAAYQARWRAQRREFNHVCRSYGRPYVIDLIAPVPPAIVSARFERDGVVLAQRNGGSAS